MMINRTRAALGGALMLIGMLALLQNLGLFRLSEEYMISLIFSSSGLALFYYGRTTIKQWALYLGGALFIVGVIIFISATSFLPDEMIGTLWLWLLAGLMYRVYHRNNDRWWSLLVAIPAFTVGAVVLLEGYHLLRGEMVAILIILGIAGAFTVLYAIRSPERKLNWAKYPAAVFYAVALIIFSVEYYEDAFPYALSGLLILTGLYLIYRTLRSDFGVSKPNLENSIT